MTEKTDTIFETKFSDNAIISFDLFDTLVEESFFQHSDLFELMNPEVDKIVGLKNFDFKKIRILAEKFAYKNKKNSETVDLNDIYSEVEKLTQLGKSYIMEIEKLELCYEQKFYQTKAIGYHMFEIAKSLNKKIVIIVDSPLPRFFIESLLERCGYTGYHELFISSEVGLSKKTGNIYTHVAEKLFCDPKYFLHIGDNDDEDVQSPQKLGFNVMPILSSQECYKNSFYYKNIWKDSESQAIFSTRLINGLLAQRFYQSNDEQGLNADKTAFNNDAYRVGYFGIGPLLLGYIQWIIQKSQEDYVKHLYFLSNHGSFIKTAYDMLAKHYSQAPMSYDLLTSAKICNLSNLIRSYELYETLEQPFNNITAKDYFYNRFGIDLSERNDLLEKHGLKIDTIINKENNEKQIFSIFSEIQHEIQERALNEKDYYAAYIRYQNLPNPDKSAIVDIGDAENFQSTLSEIAKQKIGGYYLTTFIDTIEKIKKNGMPISGYLGNFEENIKEDSLSILFGTIEKAFVTFRLDGNMINPIFLEEELNSSTQKFITTVQNAALDFIADFEKIYNKHIPQLYFSPRQVSKPIHYFLNQKIESAKLFKGVSIEKKVPLATQTKETQNEKEADALIDSENIGFIRTIGRVLLGIKKAL